VAALHAVRLEVLPIDREHLRRGERFRGGDQRGVRQIHRVIGVLLHQLERSLQTPGVEGPNRCASTCDEVAEAIRAYAAGGEHVERLGQDRDRRHERLPDGLENFSTPAVGWVLRIEERDEWPGVYQDHRRSFRRMAARTP
jgi:hypothetical protein